MVAWCRRRRAGNAGIVRALFNRQGVAIAGRDGTLAQTGGTGSTALHPTYGSVESSGALISHSLAIPGAGTLPMSFAQGARTNSLLNSVWSGAASGTPGTTPTSWARTTVGGPSTVVSGESVSFTVDGATSRIFFTQIVSVSASTVYTLSVRVKAATAPLAVNELVLWNTVPAGAGSTYSINGVSVANTALVYAGDIAATHLTVAVTPGVATARVGAQTGGTLFVSTTVELANPQVEVGSFRGLYIPTAGTTLTRAADNILWTPPSALSTTSGEVVAIAAPYLWSAGDGVAHPTMASARLFDAASGNINVIRNTTDVAVRNDAGGAQAAFAPALAMSSGVLAMRTCKWDASAVSLYRSASLDNQDVTLTAPYTAVTAMSVGATTAAALNWFGFVGTIYVPGGLTDAERIALASVTGGSLTYVG